MANTRNIVRYNSVGLFLTESPSYQPESREVKFFNRAQSLNFEVNIERQDIQHIGSEDHLDRVIVSTPKVEVKFDYLLTDGYEENTLGLNISPPNIIYDENQKPQNVKINNSGTIYNNIREDKNLFFVVGQEEFDLTGMRYKEGGFSGLNVLGVGNCFLTNYSISAGVGEMAKASVSMDASNFSFECMGSGDGGNFWEQIMETLSALLHQHDVDDTDFIRYQDGGKMLFEIDGQKELAGGATNPGLDLANKGAISNSGFVFDPSFYNSPVAAIPPGGINFKIQNIDAGGPLINGNNQGTCLKGDAHIQSFEISSPFERENLDGFESIHVYGRKLKYPQIGSLSISLLASTFNNGRFREILCQDQVYEIEIELSNNCQFLCNSRYSRNKNMVFKINNAKLDSYSINQSIGSLGTVDCSFSFSVSRNNGLFAEGTFGNNKMSDCPK